MSDFEQKKWEKCFNLTTIFIEQDVSSSDKNLSKRNFHLYASNIHDIAMHQVDKGLLMWRVGLSPKDAFYEAIETHDKFKQVVSDNSLEPRTLWESRSILIGFIAYLVNKEMSYGVSSDYKECLAEAKRFDTGAGGDELPAMQYLYEFFKSGNNDTLVKLEAELQILSSISGFGLSVASYRNYLELLACKVPEEIDVLVLAAEKNYLKRKKYRQMDASIYGGGPDNPYMVDLMLGAVLKKVNWQGESRHKWIWD